MIKLFPVVAWLSCASLLLFGCQKRETEVSFTAALEPTQDKNFDWSSATTEPTIRAAREPIILGGSSDLYLGRGPWQQGACSPIYTDRPSDSWDIVVASEDEDAEIEIEVRHCGVDDIKPWLTVTDQSDRSTRPMFLPVDGGNIKISNFYIGKVAEPSRLTITLVSEGEDFLVTGIRVLSTGKIRLVSEAW